jgi:hypothetical protein
MVRVLGEKRREPGRRMVATVRVPWFGRGAHGATSAIRRLIGLGGIVSLTVTAEGVTEAVVVIMAATAVDMAGIVAVEDWNESTVTETSPVKRR